MLRRQQRIPLFLIKMQSQVHYGERDNICTRKLNGPRTVLCPWGHLAWHDSQSHRGALSPLQNREGVVPKPALPELCPGTTWEGVWCQKQYQRTNLTLWMIGWNGSACRPWSGCWYSHCQLVLPFPWLPHTVPSLIKYLLNNNKTNNNHNNKQLLP